MINFEAMLIHIIHDKVSIIEFKVVGKACVIVVLFTKESLTKLFLAIFNYDNKLPLPQNLQSLATSVS